MKLLRLSKGKYEVLALIDERKDTCPVLDFMKRAGNLGRLLLARLIETIPESGPEWTNDRRCKRLSPHADRICQFKQNPGRGAGIRVLFFEDPGNQLILVCTEGFTKTNRTNMSAVDRAKKLREAYIAELQSGTVEIFGDTEIVETRGPGNAIIQRIH